MANKVLGQFVGKCCDANVVNNNDMHLGEKLFKNLFASAEYKRAMKNRHYIGFLGHPDIIDCMDYKDACIVMTDCQLLENGEVEGTFDLINTPVGRTVKSFIDAGVNFGISIRGAGDVASDGEVDPDTFIFRGFDLVTFPAYDDCIPEFKEVAASTDIEKQKKYKKVCATINTELKNITSSSALEVIRDQFNEGTDEYNNITDRIDELAQEPIAAELTDDEVKMDVLEQKVTALTDLYADAQNTISELEEELVKVTNQAEGELVAANSRMAHYKRIVSNQLRDANESYREQVVANTKLNSELHDVKAKLFSARKEIKSAQQLNLKYQRKIEAHSDIVSKKDSAVEDFKSQLNETVVAKTQLESKVRRLTTDNQELKDRVEAAEKMLLEYQQAYANMFASALGKHVSNLTVNSATSVKELKDMICSGTNTANVASAPDYDDEIVEGDDFIEEDVIDDAGGIDESYLDDATKYSADLVTM